MIKTLGGNHFCFQVLGVYLRGGECLSFFIRKKRSGNEEILTFKHCPVQKWKITRQQGFFSDEFWDRDGPVQCIQREFHPLTRIFLIFSSYHILTISDYAFLLLLILPLTRRRLGVRTTTQTWRSRELFSSLSLTESIFFLCFLPAPISLTGALEWVAKLSLLKLEELWLLP